MPPPSFPITSRPPPAWSWRTGPRAFGAARSKGRAHAGCDLYAPPGTAVLAVDAGVVTRAPYPFYAKTFAVEVDHGAFVARYGEIAPGSCRLRLGERVEAGGPIATVGHLVGVNVPSDMLHFELYRGTASGPLTDTSGHGARTRDGRPFYRRADLLDPTPFLDAWASGGAGVGPCEPASPAQAPAPTPGRDRPVRRGDRGEPVEALQRALRSSHDYHGAIDGDFGPLTERALRVFQTRHRLGVDGVAGPAVWATVDDLGL